MLHHEETQLAWDLVAAAGLSLSAAERDVIVLMIGTGEAFRAIAAVLTAAHHSQPLPPSLVERTAAWLDLHRGCDNEMPMRQMLADAAGQHRVSTTLRQLIGGLL